jgi:hypothetical protein
MYKVGEKFFNSLLDKYPQFLQFLNKVVVYFTASLIDPIVWGGENWLLY